MINHTIALLRRMAIILAVFSCTSLASAAETPAALSATSRVLAQSDGSRAIMTAVTVSASLTDTWAAFATAAGWKGWAAPFAQVDLRVRGLIETSYDANAQTGDPKNIQNTVLAFIPERMLAFQATRAPPGFQHAELLSQIVTVLELETLGPRHTAVRLWSVGYRNGDGFDKLLNFFSTGNAWSLTQLAQRFERGPVDWSKVLAPGAPAAPSSSKTAEPKQ
jgi:uncharacterized protein YndB with AHSA1/START domain